MSTFAISGIVFSTFALSPLNVSAAEKSDADQTEIRALKIEQAKLHAKKRLLKLKIALDLKDNQMDAWNTYSKTMTDNATKNLQILSKKRQMRSALKTKPSSIDLAKGNVKRLEHKLNQAKVQLAAFSKLYSVLDDQQKEKVDTLARRKIHREAKALRQTKKMMQKRSMELKRLKSGRQ